MAAAAGGSGRSTDFDGVFTALVTPFKDDGEVDWECYVKLCERQVAAGAGLVPCGTTGETPTLTVEEKKRAITEAIKVAKGRCKVIAGTGSNSTKGSVEFTQWAKEAGADACLVVNPYYNKPSQEGLYQHCKAVADVGLPVVLYNIPGRTGCRMTVDTAARLAEHPSVIAIKEATGSLDQASETAARCPGLTLLSGDDTLTVPLMSVGGHGVVSVLSNLAPEQVVAMVGAAQKGDFKEAGRIHRALFPVFKSMFVETNPVPVKYAMSQKGLLRPDVRLPLAQLEEGSKKAVEAGLAVLATVA